MPGDVARTLTKLWYSEHGPNFSIAGPTASAQKADNTSFFVSPEAYIEGLL